MATPTARDVMTDRVLPARADWSLQELASFFTEHSISGAPVVSEYGGVIGVVSLTDIARHDSEESTPASTETDEAPPAFYLGDADVRDEEALTALRERQATVRDIMMPAVFTVEEDAPIQEVADRMVRAQIHRLLVVHSGTKRDVAGIVSAIDVLKWVRDEREAETGAS